MTRFISIRDALEDAAALQSWVGGVLACDRRAAAGKRR
jgi:hypothetical protein